MLGTTADPSVRARAAGVGDTMDRLTRARAAAGLKRLTARFLRQTQGNVAMMFALALPVLLMITLGAIDIHQASKVKAQLQDALDAAALAAARSTFTDDVNINKVGLAALKANMPGYFGETSGDTANFVLLNNRVTGDARVNVKVLVANIVLPPYGKLLDDYLPVSTRSEVLRASRNVEVAMVLDTTGSMSGSIGDLREAAKELVKIVVQDPRSATPGLGLVLWIKAAYGDKVKVTLRFRGREMAHQELGIKVLERIRTEMDELAKVEQMPRLENRQMIMVLAPR